jgi:hypothetical protein
MNTYHHVGKGPLLTFILALCLATGGTAFAKKGGNGQTGNGGGGGGNTSPDPEYAIQADIYKQEPVPAAAEPDMIGEGCDAYNPDLKGPGIAYGGFYDHVDVAPITCAAVTTSTSESFYIRTLGLEASDSGLITAVWLTGRNMDSVLFDSETTSISPFPAPTDGSPFELPVNAIVDMVKCSKVRGKTTCTPAGSVFIGTLVFANIGF